MEGAAPSKWKEFRGQILVTTFFLGIAGLTIALLAILIPNINHLRETKGDTIPRWKCTKILAGDRIVMARHDGETRFVHVAGIRSPPTNRTELTQAAVARLELTQAEVIKRGMVAQKTLYAWINKRKAFLIPLEEQNDPEWLEAYVRVGGVDVGRRQLLYGQAYALETKHELSTEYQQYEAKAKKEKIGIWRDP